MGFGNSNNWQTEAVLRNERLAKQTSLDKLLEHVNWDAETLTLSLSGITLSWGDIEGASDVAMKSDIANVVRYTEIGENYVITQSLEATNLSITGGSVNINSSSSDYNAIYLEYVTSGSSGDVKVMPGGVFAGYYPSGSYSNRETCEVYASSGIALKKYYNGTIESSISIAANNITVSNGDIRVNDRSVSLNGHTHSDYLTSSDLSNYVKKSNNGFPSAGTNFYVLGTNQSNNGQIGYITKAELKSWLGIS